MSGAETVRLHIDKPRIATSLGDLPCSFTACQSAAYDGNCTWFFHGECFFEKVSGGDRLNTGLNQSLLHVLCIVNLLTVHRE
jgi:hypothetical protein